MNSRDHLLDPQINYFDQVAIWLSDSYPVTNGAIDLSQTLFIVGNNNYHSQLTNALLRLDDIYLVAGLSVTTFEDWLRKTSLESKTTLDKNLAVALLAQKLAVSHVTAYSYSSCNTASDLLQLFSALRQYNLTVDADGLTQLQAQVKQVEGASDFSSTIDSETHNLVSIATAWNEFISAHGLRNFYDIYDVACNNSIEMLKDWERTIIMGMHFPSAFISNWLNSALQLPSVMHFHQKDDVSTPDSDIAKWLNICFNSNLSLHSKIAKLESLDSKGLDRVEVFRNSSDVDMNGHILAQIKNALAQGIEQVTIISYDRKHLRRLRALLESHKIPVVDPAGWSLATTTAGTELHDACEVLLNQTPEVKTYHEWLNLLLDIFNDTTTMRLENYDSARYLINSHLRQLRDEELTTTISCDGTEFKQWLDYLLENQTFKIPTTGDRVLITNMEQCYLHEHEFVIFSNFTEGSLHKNKYYHLYMNDTIRYQLNLPNFRKERHIQFIQFRNMMLQSKRIAIHFCEDGLNHDVEPVRWVQIILDLKEAAGLQGIITNSTENYANQKKLLPSADFEIEYGERFSVTELIQLRICSMRYFLLYRLRLNPKASDNAILGRFLHLGLERFHANSAFFMKYQQTKTTVDSYAMSVVELKNTFNSIHGEKQEATNSKVTYWMNYKLDIFCQNYALHLLDLMTDIKESMVEYTLERKFEDITVVAKCDRIDVSQNNEHHLTDYKLGTLPSRKSVFSLDNPQLVYYSLLHHNKFKSISLVKINNAFKQLYITGTGDKQHEELLQASTILTEELLQMSRSSSLLIKRSPGASCNTCQVKAICRPDNYASS